MRNDDFDMLTFKLFQNYAICDIRIERIEHFDNIWMIKPVV